MAESTRYRFTNIDGLTIFYREAGLAEAKTIVLLHGFRSLLHMFRDLIPLLSDIESISEGFEALKPFWANRNAETEKPALALLTPQAIEFQYPQGGQDPERINANSYRFDQFLMARPGSEAIQLDLSYNYTSNVALYDEWHHCFPTPSTADADGLGQARSVLHDR